MSAFTTLSRWVAPDLRVENFLQVSPGRLCDRGIRGLLVDLDGTLKGHYDTEFAAEVTDWMGRFARAGIRLALVSNGKPDYIAPFSRMLADVPCFSRARKPLPFVCRHALSRLDVPASRAAILGDQLFTDVLAGRWAGLFTILAPPLSPIEPWHIRIRRPLERVLLRAASRARDRATPG
jgi:HAD superfamily phosphatase (TIGR01668 family)